MKRIVLLLVVAVATIIVAGCGKNPPYKPPELPPCEKNNTGTVSVTNENNEAYNIYANNVSYGIVQAASTTSFDIRVGNYDFKFVEPKTTHQYTGNYNVEMCKTLPLTLTKKASPDCEIYQFGWLTVKNTSSNPYNFYVNNQFVEQINGGASKKYEIKAGSQKLYAKQVSGYVLYPTECNATCNVVKCESYNWQIP